MQSQVKSTCPMNNDTNNHDPTFQYQHAVVAAVQSECDINQSKDDKQKLLAKAGMSHII